MIDLTDPKPRPRCLDCGGTVDRISPAHIVQVCLACWYVEAIPDGED